MTMQDKATRSLTQNEIDAVSGGLVMKYEPFAPILGRDVAGGAIFCGTVVGWGKWVLPKPKY